MTPIGQIVGAMFDRGQIPERLEAVRAAGPCRPGDVLVWVGTGWECAARGVVVAPWAARRLFWAGAVRAAKEQLCLAV